MNSPGKELFDKWRTDCQSDTNISAHDEEVLVSRLNAALKTSRCEGLEAFARTYDNAMALSSDDIQKSGFALSKKYVLDFTDEYRRVP